MAKIDVVDKLGNIFSLTWPYTVEVRWFVFYFASLTLLLLNSCTCVALLSSMHREELTVSNARSSLVRIKILAAH